MSLHFAIQALCEQSVDTIGLTTVSAVVTALGDVSAAADFIQQPKQAKALQDVLHKCMSILKNDAKNFALRMVCLECLYVLSQPPITVFRTGLLHKTLQSMNRSVEEMLTRTSPDGAESISSAREMLTVLIFRTTNYDTKVSRLLLEHVCDGNILSMLQTLLDITVHHRETCEWPLLQAALLTFYELTLPATYYYAGEDMSTEASSGSAATATDSSLQTFTVDSFKAKMTALLTAVCELNFLEKLLTSLRLSWCDSATKQSPMSRAQGLAESVTLGTLGSSDVAHTVVGVSAGQLMELQNWLAVFSLLCRALNNMIQFCPDANLSGDVRARLLKDPACHAWLASTAVPAVIAAIHTFVSGVDGSITGSVNGASSSVDPSAMGEMMRGFLATAVTLLRLLRMVLYRPVVPFSKEFLSSMTRLAEQAQREEGRLRSEYGGVLVLMLTIHSLVNMNAVQVTSPVNLGAAFLGVLQAIQSDTTQCTLSDLNLYAWQERISPGAHNPYERMLLIELLVYMEKKENSPFCETEDYSESLIAYRKVSIAGYKALAEKHTLVLEEDRLRLQFAFLQRAFMLSVLRNCLLSSLTTTLLFEGDLCMGFNDEYEGEMELLSENSVAPRKSPAKSKVKSVRHPDAYVCGLTKRLMCEPVVLKNGHRFEYDALQNIVAELGHIDPITGESIDEEIEVDIALQQEISAYRVKCASADKSN